MLGFILGWRLKSGELLGMTFLRVQIYCPISHAEALNRKLNVAWRDEGDNLSVPLSPSGHNPATFRGASGALNEPMIAALRVLLPQHPGSCAFVSQEMGAPVREAICFTYSEEVAVATDFDKCAALVGVKRIFEAFEVDSPPESSSLLLQAVVTPLARVEDGQLIQCVAIPWLAILRELERNPAFLHQFSKHHRAFEEFLAATYEHAGYTVTLTPQRGDQGRDVIAEKKGFGSVRILDQAKAYAPRHLVTHDDVRAMLGTLSTDSNASKGIITTTSDFQPGILQGEEFRRFMPYRLELKNGVQLLDWLRQVRESGG